MKRKEPIVGYHSTPALDALTRFEAARIAGVDVSASIDRILRDLHRLPVHIHLDKDLVPRYLQPLFEHHGKSYKTFGDLQESMREVSQGLTRTPSSFRLTPFVGGIYVGEPKELYAFWTADPSQTSGTLAAAPVQTSQVSPQIPYTGFGNKIAAVVFAADISELIEF